MATSLARTNTLVFDPLEGSPRSTTMAQTVAEGEAWLHRNGSFDDDSMDTSQDHTTSGPARTSTMSQTIAEAEAWLSQSPPVSPQPHSGRSSSVQPPAIRSSSSAVTSSARSASASRRPATSPSGKRTTRMSATVEEGKQWLHKSGLGRANTMERTIAESKKWLAR